MKEISLTQNKFALVDDEDYEWLNSFSWCFMRGYAVRSMRINGKSAMILMHRFIMNTPSNLEVDHIDRNRLNNQKDNLRNCNSNENHWNTAKNKLNKSGYKGVCWHKTAKKWLAYTKVNKKRIHIGYFDDIIEAAKAYDRAAIFYHGDFANLNFDRSDYS